MAQGPRDFVAGALGLLAQGGDPLEPPLACGPCDFVAGALALLAQTGDPGRR